MAKAAAISFKKFRSRYDTEESCREELFRQRFPDGFVCPKCGCKAFYAIRSRNVRQCHSCRHQTSVTAGTMMHRTHLPLTVWFWAITFASPISVVFLRFNSAKRWESAMTPLGIY